MTSIHHSTALSAASEARRPAGDRSAVLVAGLVPYTLFFVSVGFAACVTLGLF